MSISYLSLSLSGISLNVNASGYTQITNNYTTVRNSGDWSNDGSGKFTYIGTSTILVVFHSTIQQSSSNNFVHISTTLRRNGNNESNININGPTNDTMSAINLESSSLGNTTVDASINNFSNTYGILVYPNDYFYVWLYNSKPVSNTVMSGFGLNLNIMSNYLFIWKNPFNQYYLKVSMTNAIITNTGSNLTYSLTTIANSGQFSVNYGGNNGQIRYTGSSP